MNRNIEEQNRLVRGVLNGRWAAHKTDEKAEE